MRNHILTEDRSDTVSISFEKMKGQKACIFLKKINTVL